MSNPRHAEPLSVSALPEIHLQKLLRSMLADSSRTWMDITGVPLQILSVGEWNHAGGPDFKHVALLANGQLYVGDGEFHRKTSDWNAHGHQHDANYDGLLLHIILHNDSQEQFAAYTVLLPSGEMEQALQNERIALQALEQADENNVTSALEALQDYALRRMNTKSSEAKHLLQRHEPLTVLLMLIERFLQKQQDKKRRPNGVVSSGIQPNMMQQTIPQSRIGVFIREMEYASSVSIQAGLTEVLETRIDGEGAGTRLELMVNAIFPLVLALARSEQRSAVLAWFWSLPAKNTYSLLVKRFPHLPQQFVWQQQGMLEYVAEIQPIPTKNPAAIAEPATIYKAGTALSFILRTAS